MDASFWVGDHLSLTFKLPIWESVSSLQNRWLIKEVDLRKWRSSFWIIRHPRQASVFLTLPYSLCILLLVLRSRSFHGILYGAWRLSKSLKILPTWCCLHISFSLLNFSFNWPKINHQQMVRELNVGWVC